MTHFGQLCRHCLLLLAFWAVGWGSAGRAAAAVEVLRLTDDQVPFVPGSTLYYLADAGEDLTLAQVLSPAVAARFQPAGPQPLNLGFRQRPVWLRLRLRNECRVDEWRLQMNYTYLDHIDFYYPREPGRAARPEDFATAAAGIYLPPAVTEGNYPRPVFRLPLASGEETTVYLRVRGGNAMSLGLTVYALDAFAHAMHGEMLLQGLYLGCFLILILYNLLVYAALRDRSYLMLSLFLVPMTLVYASSTGLAHVYLWPDAGKFSDVLSSGLAGLGLFLSVLFMGSFLLDNDRVQPWHRRLFLGLAIYWGVYVCGSFFLSRLILIQVLLFSSVLGTLLGMAIGVDLWRRGFRPARYFVVAWCGALVGVVVSAAARQGATHSSFLLDHAHVPGVLWLGLFFSLALADRFSQLKRERGEAQALALAAACDNERLMREQNLMLEAKVGERTVELEAARRQAEAANQAKSAFLANMSHELRTPLHAILGHAQVLEQDPAEPAQVARGARSIRQSGQHLQTLIGDLLDISRIEMGRLGLEPQPTTLYELLDSVSGIIAVSARAKSLDFQSDVPRDLPAVVRADPRRLRQVLLNLLGNAVKFTAHGRILLRVETLPVPAPPPGAGPECRLRFTVEDSGVGIAPVDLRRVFQPFEQAGDSRQRAGGAGLGLAISQHLVGLMGGSIQAVSTLGEGSRFWFELHLPVLASDGTHAPAPAPAPAAAVAIPPGLRLPPPANLAELLRLAHMGLLGRVGSAAQALAAADPALADFAGSLAPFIAEVQDERLIAWLEACAAQAPAAPPGPPSS